MSTQAISKACAQSALDQLQRDSKPAQESQNTPFEYLPRSQETEEVQRQWFADVSNRQRTAQKQGVDEDSITLDCLLRQGPIRYLTTANKPGYIKKPFPNAILVIIALNQLTPSNGLPSQVKKGQDDDEPQSLEEGEDLSLSGDDSQSFYGIGGGVAYLLVFKKK